MRYLTLKDFQEKPIEEIIELYRNGYGLEESIKTLQCPSGCYSSTNFILAFITGSVTGWLLKKGYDKYKQIQ